MPPQSAANMPSNTCVIFYMIERAARVLEFLRRLETVGHHQGSSGADRWCRLRFSHFREHLAPAPARTSARSTHRKFATVRR